MKSKARIHYNQVIATQMTLMEIPKCGLANVPEDAHFFPLFSFNFSLVFLSNSPTKPVCSSLFSLQCFSPQTLSLILKALWFSQPPSPESFLSKEPKKNPLLSFSSSQKEPNKSPSLLKKISAAPLSNGKAPPEKHSPSRK